MGPIGTTFSLRWAMKEAKGIDFLNWPSTVQHPDAAESKAQLRYCRFPASNITSHLSPIHWIQIAAFVQFIAASITSLHIPPFWVWISMSHSCGSIFLYIINQVHKNWPQKWCNCWCCRGFRGGLVFSNPMTGS